MSKPKKYTTLQIIKAFKAMNEQMDNVHLEKTVIGKNGWQDVSQDDWDACSFSFDDMLKILLKKLEEDGRTLNPNQ